jgi:hypothetical protein
MSYTRLNYDQCTYQTNLRQAVGPGEYALSAAPAANCGTCFPADPYRQGGRGGASCEGAHLVDLDSELIGITRPATNCPAGHYLAAAPPPCAPRPYRDCPLEVGTEGTRLSHPPCTLRETGWNRWEWLCQDPQEQVALPFAAMVNTDIVAKDAHRPCLPAPLDQTLAFPAANEHVVSWATGCQQPAPAQAQQLQHVAWRSCEGIRAQ